VKSISNTSGPYDDGSGGSDLVMTSRPVVHSCATNWNSSCLTSTFSSAESRRIPLVQDERQIEWIGGWDADTCASSRQKGPSGNPVDEPLSRIVAQIEGGGYTPSELQ
jgi:hypothetical protein